MSAETAPLMSKKCGGNEFVRRYEHRPGLCRLYRRIRDKIEIISQGV